jgi:two-component system, OmpR family, sensor histidine kinase KdpD
MLPAAKPPTALLLACLSLTAVLACTWLAFSLQFNFATAGFLYLFLIVVTTLYGGFWIATLSSVVAVACLNYFFVPPLFSFTVTRPENWVALGAFEFTALTISRLSHRAHSRAAEAIAEHTDSQHLYETAQRILALERSGEPGSAVPHVISEVFALSGVALFDAVSTRTYLAGAPPPNTDERTRRAYDLDDDDFDPSSATWFRVLRLGASPVGALALTGAGIRPLVATAIASLVAVALERGHAFDRQCHAEAARHSEQLRTAVLEALAHEFKTPLTIIHTVSSGLLAAGDLSDTHTELVTLLDQQSRKLNDLASRLLSAGNLDVAEFQPQCEALFVSDLVHTAIGTACPEESRGRFACSMPRDEVPVLADRKLMSTALAQLVDNAVKYSEPDSPIGIAVALVNQEVTISIESHGDPIPPADCERVFDRFYRAAGAPSRPPGTGLGLSIVRRIVDAHCGRVWAESAAGGRSIFSIALPATPNRL